MLSRVIDREFAQAHEGLPGATWRALEEAHEALLAGGLPCGASLADASGTVIAAGRNHAFDPPSHDDVLEGTPLAHAEMNVLARVPTERDLSSDTLWSTQQPCAMCSAAIAFCGVGEVRFIAADPAFLGTSDPRAGVVSDPLDSDVSLAPWAALANAMFLHPTIHRQGRDNDRVHRNRTIEPEFTDLAVELCADEVFVTPDLATAVAALWPRLAAAANKRQARLASPT